ncbi:MAG: galactokinase family protein, partial [Candidatus Fimadaptatus sp.]
MTNLPDILKFLRSSEAANKFSELYGTREGMLVYQMERYCRIAKRFYEEFGSVEGVNFFSAPGRTEIGGNHTDHQSGRVLA